MKQRLLALSLLSVLFLAAAEYRVTGKVTSPSMKGVMFCDGENFHPVNADGTYAVTFQSDAETPFVYLYVPTPLRAVGDYGGRVKPGENQMDFTLESYTPSDTFRFIHGSDVQYDFTKKKVELMSDFREIRDVMKAEKCEFLLLPGDHTPFGEIANLKLLREALTKNALRCYTCFGAHDRYRSKPTKLSHLAETFKVPWSSWEYNGIHFISALSEVTAIDKNDAARSRRWMVNDLRRLAPGTPVVIVIHNDHNGVIEELLQTAKNSKLNVLGIFGGHYHYDNFFRAGKEKIPCFCNDPLRAHDVGTYTKKLRIVEISATKGVLKTFPRFMNQRRRIENQPTGDPKFIRLMVCDTVMDAAKVTAQFNGKNVEFKQVDALHWEAALPEIPQSLLVKVESTGGSGWRGVVKTGKSVPGLLWSRTTGNTSYHYPKVCAVNGKLYLPLSEDNLGDQPGVLCLDAQSGKTVWRTALPEGLSAGCASDGDRVWAMSSEGTLFTFDAATGKVLFTTPSTVKSSVRWHEVHAEPEWDGRQLYCAMVSDVAQHVLAYDRDGKLLWHHSPGNASSGGRLFAADNRIYYSGPYCYGALSCDGKVLWNTKDKAIKSGCARPSKAADGNVYFYLRSKLLKVDGATGKIIWQRGGMPSSTFNTAGALDAGSRCFGFSTNACVTLDNADGGNFKRVNINPLPTERGVKFQFLANTAAPVKVNDRVIVFADDGGVYEIDPATSKPKLLWETGTAFKGDPAVMGGVIYVMSFDGCVYAFRP